MTKVPSHKSLISFFVLGGIVLFFFYACGGNESSTPVVVKRPVKKKEKILDHAALPTTEKKVDFYVYDPQGRRDPFRSLLVGRKAVGEEEQIEIVNELQKHDLGSLKLVGVMWGEVGRIALFETPDGKGYAAQVGMPIGKGNSHVKEITSDKVVIVQRFKNVRGQVETREVALQLKKEEG